MLSIYKLYTKEGIDNYKLLLSSLGINNPYYLPDYIDIFSGGLENLICFSFISDENNFSVIMPGYLRPVAIGGEKTDYFDFTTPYGYTGPFFSSNTRDLDICEFWKNVDQWYLDNNVVSEFIRFNLSGNYNEYSGDVVPTMLNVKGKIIDEESQWVSFNHKVRKNVNKAKRENLTSEVHYKNIEEDKILEFYDIYTLTMKRTNATVNFLYSFDDFKNFINYNEKHVAICTVYFDAIPISSELLLVSEQMIYSFLGGTDENYYEKRPNDFLKVETLNWARFKSKKYYVLGGGYGFEDGIFKYKKSFFPNDVVSYYTGRKIINQKIYDQFLEKASELRVLSGLEKLNSTDTSFFPLYNKLN